MSWYTSFKCSYVQTTNMDFVTKNNSELKLMLSSVPGHNVSVVAKCYTWLKTCSLIGNNTDHWFVSELQFGNRIIKGGTSNWKLNKTVQWGVSWIVFSSNYSKHSLFTGIMFLKTVTKGVNVMHNLRTWWRIWG
jgi:hypothetical protein